MGLPLRLKRSFSSFFKSRPRCCRHNNSAANCLAASQIKETRAKSVFIFCHKVLGAVETSSFFVVAIIWRRKNTFLLRTSSFWRIEKRWKNWSIQQENILILIINFLEEKEGEINYFACLSLLSSCPIFFSFVKCNFLTRVKIVSFKRLAKKEEGTFTKNLF